MTQPSPFDALRQQLLAQRADLVAQLHALRGETDNRADSASELQLQSGDSRAQNNTERELHYALDEHDTAEVAAIDAALQRMDEGDYGRCGDCGVDIPLARLQAAPEATRCIHCQENFEAQHSHA